MTIGHFQSHLLWKMVTGSSMRTLTVPPPSGYLSVIKVKCEN